jgi:hypothetical protein
VHHFCEHYQDDKELRKSALFLESVYYQLRFKILAIKRALKVHKEALAFNFLLSIFFAIFTSSWGRAPHKNQGPLEVFESHL